MKHPQMDVKITTPKPDRAPVSAGNRTWNRPALEVPTNHITTRAVVMKVYNECIGIGLRFTMYPYSITATICR